MVGSDFSMDIPIKTTLNLQLHYTRTSHLKWPSLKGTNTDYPNKSQFGRKDIKWIHKSGWENRDQEINCTILHDLHGMAETPWHSKADLDERRDKEQSLKRKQRICFLINHALQLSARTSSHLTGILTVKTG